MKIPCRIDAFATALGDKCVEILFRRRAILSLVNYTLAGMLGTLVAVSIYMERVRMSDTATPAAVYAAV